MKYKFLAVALIAGIGFCSSCKDEFSEINQNPSNITDPDSRYLFTECLYQFEPADYYAWFYPYQYVSKWGQTLVPLAGNTEEINVVGKTDGTGMAGNMLRMANDFRNYVDTKLSGKEQVAHQYMKAILNPLCVYLAILESDMLGSRPYSEAYMARYTNPPLLTPKYDTQEELFQQWLDQLDEAIRVLSSPLTYEGEEVQPITLGAQDFVYKGDAKKWLKFTNSLKLKIAARLVNADLPRAIRIAEETAKVSDGYVASLDDNFIYMKGKKNNHWNNDLSSNAGSRQLIEFLVNNRDPRLRFIFAKNDFNSNVVQAYFDQEKELPSYIAANVEFELVGGKKKFKDWKAPGEPWVRYYGLPVEADAKNNSNYVDYFDPQNKIFNLLTKDNVEKDYQPMALINREIIKGQYTYTYPDAPDVNPEQEKASDNDPGWSGLYLSCGEVNLLLAEFKTLGASLPETAQEYFTRGVRLSIESYDQIAGLNHIPYYDKPYSKDLFDVTIELKTGEVAHVLSQPAYQLTGNKQDDLEKIYIQQYIQYILSPFDMFSTVRRSGVPKLGSAYLPFVEFGGVVSRDLIPRRFPFDEPSPSDLMYQITMDAIQAQGFSMGNRPIANLNTQRVWYDKNAPQFGEGPNY